MEESKKSDAELVTEALCGEHEAFAVIVARYQTLICALTYSGTGCRQKSEELAHDVFVAAWKDLEKLREPASLKPWLCGIAKNQIRNFSRKEIRARNRSESITEDDFEACSGPNPSDLASSMEEEAIVWRALQGLPEAYREPMVLYYREQQSIENVARALDLSNEVVRQRLSRGRRQLQSKVLGIIGGVLRGSAPTATFTIGVLSALRELSPAVEAAGASSSSAAAVVTKTAGGQRMVWFWGLGGVSALGGALLLTHLAADLSLGNGLPGTDVDVDQLVSAEVAEEVSENRVVASVSPTPFVRDAVTVEHPLVELRRLYREAEGLVSAGRRDEAVEIYERLLSVAREADEPWYAGRALWRLGGTASQDGQLVASVELLEEALVHMREYRERTGRNVNSELRLLNALLWHYHNKGELTLARMANWRAEETAVEYLAESLPGFDPVDFLHPLNGYLERLQNNDAVVRILLNEGYFLGFWGDIDEAIRLTGDVATSLEGRLRLTDRERHLMADAYYFLITYFDMQLRLEEKREIQRRLYAMNPEGRVRRTQVLDRLRETYHEGKQAERDPGALLHEVEALLTEIASESRQLVLRVNRYLAHRLGGVGRVDAGVQLLSESIAEAETVDLPETEAVLRHHRAILRLNHGILDGVEEDLLAALDFYRRSGFVLYEAMVYRDYARWLTLSGRYGEAMGIVSLGLERAGRFASVRLRNELLAIGQYGKVEGTPRSISGKSDRVDLQPIRMVTRVHKEELGRGRFTLVNTGLDRSVGELVIDAPVTADDWNADRGIWAVAVGSKGEEVRRGFLIEPGERLHVYLESSAEVISSGSEFSVRWESQESQEAWWHFDGAAELETASVIQASLAMENPFYPVALYHEIYLRDGNHEPVDFRVRSSFPAYIQVVDADTGRLLAIDSTGNGRFDGVGDAVFRDVGRNGYPDFEVNLNGGIPAIEIHVYPDRNQGEVPEEIVVAIDLRSKGGEWRIQAENRLLTVD